MNTRTNQSMPVVSKMSPLIGAQVTGVDLTLPMDQDSLDALNRALVDNIALVIRDQHFTAQQFVDAGRLFGEPMERDYSDYNVPGVPFVHHISSHDQNKDGSLKKTGPRWHTDHANHEYPPKYTALYAIELFRTGGGSTGIANMRAAFDALPARMQERISSMQTVNVIAGSASKNVNSDRLAWQAKESPPPVLQPLVLDAFGPNPEQTHYLTGSFGLGRRKIDTGLYIKLIHRTLLSIHYSLLTKLRQRLSHAVTADPQFRSDLLLGRPVYERLDQDGSCPAGSGCLVPS